LAPTTTTLPPTTTTLAPTTTLPPPTLSTLDVLRADQQLTSFAQIVVTAGMEAQMAEPGAYTVFAPTNAAIDLLPGRDALFADPAMARQFVESNVVAQALTVEAMAPLPEVTTINGTVLTLQPGWVQAGRIVVPDQLATNGVVHVVDPAAVAM
jgi:uncharacterized surface protein with fasciclin (FAS1) repeats